MAILTEQEARRIVEQPPDLGLLRELLGDVQEEVELPGLPVGAQVQAIR